MAQLVIIYGIGFGNTGITAKAMPNFANFVKQLADRIQ